MTGNFHTLLVPPKLCDGGFLRGLGLATVPCYPVEWNLRYVSAVGIFLNFGRSFHENRTYIKIKLNQLLHMPIVFVGSLT